MSIAVHWIVAVYLSYLCVHHLTKALLRPKMSSAGTYIGLLRSIRSSDFVDVADFNFLFGYLAEMERPIGGQSFVPADRINNGHRLVQVCSDHPLFLPNIDCGHKK